jgi:hypothetical protein
MNNETLDSDMFSDIEVEQSFDVEEIRYDEPELYQAIIGGVL